MLSFSLWGGLGELGEARVKCGGNPTTLGAHAPTKEASANIVLFLQDLSPEAI
jgi:hypothetical protein